MRVVLLLVLMIIGEASNGSRFFAKNILPGLLGYPIVGIASYILFGKFTLWHRSVGSGNFDDKV